MQRKFTHWTPTYIRNRLLVIYDERKHPGNPWLTRDGVRFLDQALKGSAACKLTRCSCDLIGIDPSVDGIAEASRERSVYSANWHLGTGYGPVNLGNLDEFTIRQRGRGR